MKTIIAKKKVMETKMSIAEVFTIDIWCENCRFFYSHQVSFIEHKQQSVLYKKICKNCEHECFVTVPEETWINIKK